MIDLGSPCTYGARAFTRVSVRGHRRSVVWSRRPRSVVLSTCTVEPMRSVDGAKLRNRAMDDEQAAQIVRSA